MTPFRLFPILLAALLLFPVATIPAAAQVSPVPPADVVEAPLTTESLQSMIEAAKSDGSLDETAKGAVVKRYEAALANVEAAAKFREQTATIEQEISHGPGETTALRKALDDRQAGRIPAEAGEAADLPGKADAAAIEARLTSERARLAGLGRQMRDAESRLAELETRPSANRARFAEATQSLSEAERALSKWNGRNPASHRERADLAFERSLVAVLRAELEMLEREALSFDIRRGLYQARLDLAASDLGLARERVARIEARSNALVNERIGEAERLIDRLGLQAISEDPEILRLVEESRELARKNESLLGRIASAEAERIAAEDEFDRIRREAAGVRAQIEIAGLEDYFLEVVLELRRSLPTPQSVRASTTARREEIAAARLAAFRGERELDEAPSTAGQVEEVLDLLRGKGGPEEGLAELRPGLGEFFDNRTRLMRDCVAGNRRLATVLGEVDQAVNETLSVAGELRDFLGERLVWTASAPPLGLSSIAGTGTAFRSILGKDVLAEYAGAVARIPLENWIVALVLAFFLFAPRRKLGRLLAQSSARTGHISVDRIGNTVAALAASFWLALPFPALLGYFGWVFTDDLHGTEASYALGKGFLAPVSLLLLLRFSSILCQEDGVGESHFRWRSQILVPLRRLISEAILLYLPVHVLLTLLWFNLRDLSAFQGPGRIAFVGAMLALAMLLNRFFRRVDGALSQLGEANAPIARWRKIWTGAVVVFPVILAILAAAGHFLTSLALAILAQKTGNVLLGALLVFAFLQRWAELRARRFAYAKALARRDAKRVSQEADAEAPSSDRPVPVNGEESVDLVAVGEQTRHLIRAVVSLFAVFGCWLAWSEALPVLKYFDNRPLFAEVSLGDLVWLGLIGMVTWIVIRNLPGLLELGFLRAFGMEAGVRNALVTLCQYAVIAIGVVVAFQTLGLDWSSFGWIAAALSVGLGFGLQEVVANFVSGLILLFERPIRVGDIVTVAGVDGVVTKIRIRATTITNWDRKEFIVPNKEFVTGTIMNWTLTSQITRLVFPVGIAYGSDVAKAREILLEIARSQPEVLDEPAPAAIFEQFGDSCLNFTLRCFLADTDLRLEMTHRINSLIHERFAAAGIEIPFPQRDLHLRSVDSSISLGKGDASGGRNPG